MLRLFARGLVEMAAIETGRVCIKTRGREAGKKVAIVETGKGTGFVVIDGAGTRRRRCNIRHLFPTSEKIDVAKGMKHEDIVKAIGETDG